MVMGGGVAGLPLVPNAQWNGLPVLLFLGACSLACALPVGLALARQSTRPWLFRSAVVVIETLRGIPMVTLCRRLKHSWFLLTFSSSSMHRFLESPGS